jgi:hypothetical protein
MMMMMMVMMMMQEVSIGHEICLLLKWSKQSYFTSAPSNPRIRKIIQKLTQVGEGLKGTRLQDNASHIISMAQLFWNVHTFHTCLESFFNWWAPLALPTFLFEEFLAFHSGAFHPSSHPPPSKPPSIDDDPF